MKSQERRDEEAVTIFTGLLLFVLVAAVGALVLVLVHQSVSLRGDVLSVLVYVVLGCAVAASIRYIYRHRPR
jgi:ACR3 family arsenite efflux pump ArsB